jgi:nucleoside-triphosphatase THEP1
MSSPRRILIIGAPGVGKTTYARKLGEKLQIQYIEVDRIYWKEKKGGKVNQEFESELLALTNKDEWIIEGLSKLTIPLIGHRITFVHFIRIGYLKLLFRSIRRLVLTGNWTEFKMNLDPAQFKRRRDLYNQLLSRYSIAKWWEVI